MRCLYCGKMNPPEAYYCTQCAYPLHQGPPPQHPPQESDTGKTVSIVVIIVVIVIAFFVLASCAMAGILYVWVTSLEDTGEERVDNLRLNVRDGAFTQEEGAGFTTSDSFLKIEQIGGSPIDWNDLTIYCEVTDSGNRIELRIREIAGIAFDPITNYESQTGEIIILGVWNNGDFSNGDHVDITIVKGEAKVYSQKSIRVV